MPVGKYVRILMILSWLGSTAMSAIIHFNKELHVHPMSLVEIACLFQSAFFYSYIVSHQICILHLPEVYQWTLSWTVGLYDSKWQGINGLYRATQTLNGSNYFVLTMVWYIGLYVNFVICLDLLVTLHQPFRKPSNFTSRRITNAMINFVLAVFFSYTIMVYHLTDTKKEAIFESYINGLYYTIFML